jgi:hypothetical protein
MRSPFVAESLGKHNLTELLLISGRSSRVNMSDLYEVFVFAWYPLVHIHLEVSMSWLKMA